jgi:hypothetical protein
MHRTRNALVLATLSTVVAVAAPVAAQAADAAIGPGQNFIGQVNSSSQSAVITVVCLGPASTGRPFGDTVSVVQLVGAPLGAGYTGDAKSISVDVAFISPAPRPAHVATFTAYTSQDFPPTLLLPCSGAGTVTFTPVNGGPSAVPTTVKVTFRNIGAVPPG